MPGRYRPGRRRPITHGKRMALYDQGALTNGPFRLNRYPRSKAALLKALGQRRFAF